MLFGTMPPLPVRVVKRKIAIVAQYFGLRVCQGLANQRWRMPLKNIFINTAVKLLYWMVIWSLILDFQGEKR
jgi:hypothetical protein